MLRSRIQPPRLASINVNYVSSESIQFNASVYFNVRDVARLISPTDAQAEYPFVQIIRLDEDYNGIVGDPELISEYPAYICRHIDHKEFYKTGTIVEAPLDQGHVPLKYLKKVAPYNEPKYVKYISIFIYVYNGIWFVPLHAFISRTLGIVCVCKRIIYLYSGVVLFHKHN